MGDATASLTDIDVMRCDLYKKNLGWSGVVVDVDGGDAWEMAMTQKVKVYACGGVVLTIQPSRAIDVKETVVVVAVVFVVVVVAVVIGALSVVADGGGAEIHAVCVERTGGAAAVAEAALAARHRRNGGGQG